MRKSEKLLDDFPREYIEEQIFRWVRDEKARYCLVRNFLDGVPYEQIAEELNIVTTTVYYKIRKYQPILFDKLKN